MRPLKLQVEGFTCYRERQEIDFERLKLFAIAGPTGAGKSTLLDAITFALYGQIPRMGSRNLDEFISLGAKEASVALDFELHGGRRYRVARTMRRSGAKKAQLEELRESGPQPLQDGVTAVNQALTPLLGLRYETFVQAVLLPQGKFAEFLQGDKGKRREILRELLRLGVYEEMRKRAESRKRELETELKTLDQRLEQDYGEATAENLAAQEAEEAALVAQCAQAEVEAGRLAQEAQRLNALWALQAELAAKRRALEGKEAERGKVESDRKRAQRARRAAALRPYLERVSRAAAERDERRGEEAGAVTAERARLAGKEQARAALAEATEAAAEVPALRTRREELLAVLPLLPERDRVEQSAKGLQAELAKERAEAGRQREEAEKSRADERRLAERLAALVERQAALGYDGARHERLLGLREPAGELRRVRPELRTVSERLGAQREALEAARRESAAAAVGLEEAEQAVRAARSADMAADLRRHLHAGDNCPVCGQLVDVLPEVAPGADVGALERAEKAARVASDGARTRLASAESALREREGRREELTGLAARLEALLRESAPELGGDEAPEEATLAALEEIDQQSRERQAIEKEWNALEMQRREAEGAAQRAADAAAHAEKAGTRLEQELAAARERLAEYGERIAAAGSADPQRDKGLLERRIEGLTNVFEKARQAAEQAEAGWREAAQTLAVAQSARQAADLAAEEAAESAERESRTAGFQGEEEARAAALAAEELAALEAGIERYERDVQALRAAIEGLEERLGGARVDEEQVRAASESEGRAREELRALVGGRHRLAERLEALRAAVAKAAKLRQERTEVAGRQALQAELALELRSDRFQQHLLDEAFQQLVAGASVRLRQLNERYSLHFSDDAFVVLDHDHGGEQRSADTLSGGETFLASLALALELSEQVQQAAGAVRLDSLFIDEGFGTLDPETLDVVAGAIEALSAGERMIGVISHVAELHRRLPARLEVRPGPQGSRVELVEAG